MRTWGKKISYVIFFLLLIYHLAFIANITLHRCAKFSSDSFLTFPLSTSCMFYFNSSSFFLYMSEPISPDTNQTYYLHLQTLTNRNARLAIALLGTPSVLRQTVISSIPSSVAWPQFRSILWWLPGTGTAAQWRAKEFCSGEGVRQIQLRKQDRENGDLEAAAP